MKKILNIIIVMFVILLLTGCKGKQELKYKIIKPTNDDKINIVVTSDIHFLSNNVVEEGSFMKRPNQSGDGRIIVYNEEIIDVFINDMIKIKPAAVVITGDLTFDGSQINHLSFAKKLDKLVENDIRVLVSNGNHDLNNNASYLYMESGIQKIPTTTSKDFLKIYYNHGFGNSIMRDKNSLSYLYQISNDLAILMLDSCIYVDGDNYKTNIAGNINDKTMDFIKKSLEYAKNHNLEVITTSHHNLYSHNPIFNESYKLPNSNELISIFKEYNVRLHLSGHMHIQHFVKGEITEILTSSLSMYSHHYGLITYSKNSDIDYKTQDVEVSEYFKKLNSTNEDLLNFKEYSFNFFKTSSYFKKYEGIMFEDSSMHEEANALATIQAMINPYYFNGNGYIVIEEVLQMPEYQTMLNIKYQLGQRYILSMIEESKEDYRYITIR